MAASSFRNALTRYIPAHFRDPFGLAGRLVRSGSPEAWFAMFSAGAALAALPLDLLLRPFERRQVENAPPPTRPIVFVMGPPRGGTTLVSQALIRFLPVAYVNNLTSIFPRSPIVANRLLERASGGLWRAQRNSAIRPQSHYGKTLGLAGPNDGLQLWDRWIGADRTRIPERLEPEQRRALVQFFGAYEAAFGRPVLNKNNNLNLFASVVAEALPTARFLCMEREPLFLAQSLLDARRHIHGDDRESYGLDDPQRPDPADVDPVLDVCRQLRFHRAAAREQMRRIGSERCWVVSYEEFCTDPATLVERVGSEWLGVDVDAEAVGAVMPGFVPSRRRRISEDEFARLEAELADLAPPNRLPPVRGEGHGSA